jgi:hypothetical protein
MVSMQEFRNNINADYYCEKAQQSGLFRVFNADEDLMVEYSQNTGAVRWQRHAGAPQKAAIERWLTQHLPVFSSEVELSSRL